MPVYIKVKDNQIMLEKLIKKLKFGSCKTQDSDNVNIIKESEKSKQVDTRE